jgi:hypothetical protein
MKKAKVILISVVSLIILGATGLFLVGYYAPKPGGIRIETNLTASVYIDGILVGQTPYQSSYKAGKILLRLVPLGSSENLVSFETSITLVSGIETVIRRNFNDTEDTSSGHVISFEKVEKQTSGLIVVSQPENAQVLIDGVSRGFSPYSTSSIAPAMHTIAIKSPGYSDLSMTIKTLTGYRLTFYAKLEKNLIPETTSENPIQEIQVKKVKILDTPTGYLRVRSAPGKSGEEIAQVKPGESFPYLDTDIASGWIEIQYQAPKTGLPSGIVGWISNEYASVSSELN